MYPVDIFPIVIPSLFILTALSVGYIYPGGRTTAVPLLAVYDPVAEDLIFIESIVVMAMSVSSVLNIFGTQPLTFNLNPTSPPGADGNVYVT